MTTVAVHNEQVRTLYSQSLPVLFASVANSIIVSATLWRSAPHWLLLGWTGAMALMTLIRVELRRRYWRAKPGPEEAVRWGRWFVLGSMSAGALWGAAGALLFATDGLLSRLLITFAIGGMGAGAAGTLSCYPPAFVAYLVPALLPLTVRTAMIGDRVHLSLAVMLVVYGAALSVVARITHRSITESFRLRFENDALLTKLSSAQATLEETNRGLEARVAERTAELELQGHALRDAQRMEAVGRLAGGIAHDFNNLLTIMHANVDLLRREEGLDAAAVAAIDDMRSAAARGADLVRQLLAFSRRQKLAPRVLDANDLVANLDRLLRRLLGETVRMEVTLARERALVKVDPGQLEQVILNLVTNARDAMPRGGTLTVTTSTVVSDGDATLRPGSYVVLSVSDTGVGMDADTQRRVFDPFFTTKDVGRGTGLGLATVYGIVDQSGGRVLIDSQPGEGSTFDVYLPRVTEADRAAEQTEPGLPQGPALGATVLIAEDAPEVRSVTGRLLRLAGYDVLLAANGKDALVRARAYPGAIDLLITDVVMGAMGGVDLARELCLERPRMRVLFVSGYSWDADLPPANPAAGIDYLQKPLTFETLTKKVTALLAATNPAASRFAVGPRPPPGK